MTRHYVLAGSVTGAAAGRWRQQAARGWPVQACDGRRQHEGEGSQA